VWIEDVATVLRRAGQFGARTVTEPTPFYGETTLGRLLDPWQNLWWVYAPAPGQADPKPHWEGGSDTVFTTLDSALRELGQTRSWRSRLVQLSLRRVHSGTTGRSL
jgi:PhnB protein